MTSTRSRLAAVSALALMMTAVPALAQGAAQETPWLSRGSPTSGVLEDGDERGRIASWNDDEYVYDDYLIQAQAGERFSVALSSGDFDSYVLVYLDGHHERGEPLASDDDGGGYPDALLRFTAEQEGLYRVRVRGFRADSRGDYTLTLSERPPAPPAPPPTSIDSRGEVSGQLAQGDPELDREELYDAYRFPGRQGDRIDIRLNSDDFDPVLYVGRISQGGGFEELAVNDDGGGDLNSLVRFTVPEDGDYVIRAAAYSSGGEGPYVLSLADSPPPPVLAPLAVGDEIEGRLDDDALQDADEIGYVGYVFEARVGQRVVFAMSSDDFDSYVELGREGAAGYEVIAHDDDGAGRGLDARLVHTFAEGGRHEVRARSYDGWGTGAYTLTATEVEPDPEPTPLPFGQSVQGEITDASAQGESGGRFDAYRFDGVEGQRVQVVMRSGDFDTYLHIGRAGGEFESLAYDDDGLGEGLNSRLNFTLPEDGAYIIRATSYAGRGSGLYALELTDRGPAPVAGSLLIGATVRGHLDETDSMAPGDSSFYDDYRFQAQAGDRLRITMVSNEFDAFLLLGRGLADAFEVLATDDDGLSDTNSLIEHEITESGWYVLRANSYAPNSTGAYVLSIERRP